MYNIEFYFYNFTCYLEHSVRNPLRLFRECGCEFLVYIGYFTCAVSLFFFVQFVNMCCSFCGWFILFSFEDWANDVLHRVMPRRKKNAKNYWKRKPDETDRCMFGGKQEKCGSCHIVLDLLISPHSANLLRLHLPRQMFGRPFFGFLLTGTRFAISVFRPALHKTCHGVRLVA